MNFLGQGFQKLELE